MSIVFIRLDKIGDLVSTLPMDQLPSVKTEKIRWVIADGLGKIVEKSLPQREFLELSLKKDSWKSSYRKLLNFLVQTKPSSVVIFYGPWWAAYACWKAKVPLRAGRRSQWWSYLFLNKGIRQSRTEAKMHEADYNRELLERSLNLPALNSALLTPNLILLGGPDAHLLEKYNLQNQKFVVVHPGMFGSALNWPQFFYNQLIEQLCLKTVVVVTGTKADEKFLFEIKSKWQHHPKIRILQDKLSMTELISVLSMSAAVVAPSTGVLHLAASLGVPSLGIYSPIQVHHPKRWGPRGHKTHVFLPRNLGQKNCPATMKCLGASCSFFPCMKSISVDSVYRKVVEYLG